MFHPFLLQVAVLERPAGPTSLEFAPPEAPESAGPSIFPAEMQLHFQTPQPEAEAAAEPEAEAAAEAEAEPATAPEGARCCTALCMGVGVGGRMGWVVGGWLPLNARGGSGGGRQDRKRRAAETDTEAVATEV